MREKKRTIILGILLSIWFTVKLSEWSNSVIDFIFGPIIGFGLGFLISKSITKDTAICNSNGDDIIHRNAANHIKNGVSVGGELYLLKDRIEFKTHNFNLSDEHLIITLDAVKHIELYNNLGFIKNGLKIYTIDNTVEKFIVKNRQLWYKEIIKSIHKS